MAHTAESETERYSGSYEKDPQEFKANETSVSDPNALRDRDVESQKASEVEARATELDAAGKEDEEGAGFWGWSTVCGASVTFWFASLLLRVLISTSALFCSLPDLGE